MSGTGSGGVTALGLDTSTAHLVLGVSCMGSPVVDELLDLGGNMCERLPAAVSAALKRSKVRSSRLDFIAFASGPGSFTGLRIGLSFVNGFAFAGDVPVIPVPVLELLALRVPACKGVICSLVHARREEFYYQLFDGMDGSPLNEPGISEIGNLLETLPPGTMLTGPQIGRAAQAAVSRGITVDNFELRINFVRGRDLIAVAEKKWSAEREKFKTGNDCELLYILPPPAGKQVKKNKR